MEVWLLESVYGETQYEEIFLHLSGSDIWITDTGFFDEHLENVGFTELFWKSVEEEDGYQWTKLGVI